MDDFTQQGQNGKGSLEEEPYAIPEHPEETLKSERMRVEQTSTRGRADISLESLEKRASRNYDPETPRLINEINFHESAEKQREQLQALTNVSVQIIAQILARNSDAAKKIDLNKFKNIPFLEKYLDSIHPKAAENAAMHKLLEMCDNITAPASVAMKEIWPDIVDQAKNISREISALLKADFGKKHPEKSEGFVSKSVEFVKRHPVISASIAIAGAYGIYKLWNWMFSEKDEGKGEKTAEEGKESEKKEPEKKEGGFLKWVVGIGIAVGSIFGLGRLLGSDGVKKWIKDKLGWNISDNRIAKALTCLSEGEFTKAAKTIWEGVDENADFHEKMAGVISKDQKKEVTAKTLFVLKDEKFEDFLSWESQAADMVSKHAAEIPYLGKAMKLFLDSEKENEEQIAVRGFLQKYEKTVRKIMPVRESTTVETVMHKLYAHLIGERETVPAAVAGIAAAGATAGAAKTETGSPAPTSDIPEQSRRDAAIENLPKEKQRRAVENENVLKEKITIEEIAQMQEDIDDREEALRDLLAQQLEPNQRQKVEAKLAILLGQKEEMGKLVNTHSEAAAAYLAALESDDVKEEVFIERYVTLVETKEAIEDLHSDVFRREGWTEIQALAATHAARFLYAAHRRWLKTEDINTDHANYLFDKFIDRLKFKRRPRPIPMHTLNDVKTRTAAMFEDIDKSIKQWNTEASGMKKEWMQRKHFEALDRFEAEAGAQHKALDRLWKEKTTELRAAVKANDTPRVKALQTELNEVAQHKMHIEFGQMRNYGGWFKRWQEAFKGNPQSPVYEQGINRLRMFFRETLRTSKKLQAASEAVAQHTLSKVLLRKGRLVFLAGSLILGGETLADEKTGRTKAYVQAGLTILPVAGTYLDFYSAIAGKEQITGRKLDTTDRALAAVFGTVGLACDALTVLGVGLAGRAALTAIKGGRGMSAAIRAARAASKIEKARNAAEAGKALKTVERLQTARKWGFRVSLGTALGVPAYMAFFESAELPVSEDFRKEVIGDAGIEVAPS